MSDAISRFGNSIYQHGPLNDRIYLMKLSPDDVPDILEFFEELSDKSGYSKIFVKVPASVHNRFGSRGYRVEAWIPGFYKGTEDGYFMARYPDDRREREPGIDRIREMIRKCVQKAEDSIIRQLPEGYSLKICEKNDAGEIADLYGRIFTSYPFPIHDAEYIRETLEDNFKYFAAMYDGNIVAVASTEMNWDDKNVEMTDFATDPSHTGLNLAGHLLERMEQEMKKEGMMVAFTICRAGSFPINITFTRAEYRYAGTLLNNTNICGSFESMNVWYKALK